MNNVTLVRHGQTDWNLEGRIQGSTDIPLNATGRRQASEAADAIAVSEPVFLAASDLDRARETAAIIGAHRGWGEPTVFPALRERMYGDAEGTLVAEFASTFGSWYEAVVPGAETRDELLARGLDAVRALAAAAPAGHHVVAVSHGAMISTLLRHLAPEALPDGARVTNGAAYTFAVEGSEVSLAVTTERSALRV